MTPNDLADQLAAASRSLIAVLDEESAALAEVRINRVAELREEKESAAALYEAIVRDIGNNPDLFDTASPATRHSLSVVKDALDTAAVRNINALRAALEMNHRLVQTIATSVDRQRISSAGYTKTGSPYSRSQSPKSRETVPISLNEIL